MHYAFIIRQAAIEDAEAVYEILQSSFREYCITAGIEKADALTETVEDIRKQILSNTVYIAEVDKKTIGTLRLTINGEEAYLSRFAVDKNCRNNGVGETLMAVAEKYLISMGVRRIVLHTASRHTSLMRFYLGRGFYVEAIETDRGYLRARLVKELHPGN
ncbi:MAG: GNAT family N-acetyltransferase [Clostridiaceae bacterium]|nr:GNAT family N-acetyltransferase [Clostridiaceae bacterium]